MSGAGFDASLPAPHSERWREAYSVGEGESPRMASYQPPGGDPVPFILGGIRFTGGQSKDTSEYPFGGLWSSEYLNEKPQKLDIDGFLRGSDYIARRNAMVEALRAPTGDDSPGFLDLPFWGRFPVVVGENYAVAESSDEQGQCRLSIPFTRAGAGIEERMGESPAAAADLEAATGRLRLAAIGAFLSGLPSVPDAGALRVAFGQITNALMAILGRIRAARNLLDILTANALGTMRMLDEIIRSPRELALAVFNSTTAITAGLTEIRNSGAMYGRAPGNPLAPGGGGGSASAGGAYPAGDPAGGGPSLPEPDNERNVLLLFLAADSFAAPGEAATASQAATRAAAENLYKTAAFLASAEIVAGMGSLTREKAAGYWRLLERLGESVDRENPAVHEAMGDALAALSRGLSARGLSAEMTREIPKAVPLLYLAHRLGCGEDALRRLNRIPDSFVIEGEATYV